MLLLLNNDSHTTIKSIKRAIIQQHKSFWWWPTIVVVFFLSSSWLIGAKFVVVFYRYQWFCLRKALQQVENTESCEEIRVDPRREQVSTGALWIVPAADSDDDDDGSVIVFLRQPQLRAIGR